MDGSFYIKDLPWFSDLKSPIILDIGAYNGEDSKIYFDSFDDARVYAFEADPNVCEIFKKDCSDYIENQNFTLVEKAISNIDGTIVWYGCVIDKELDKYPKEVPDYYGNFGPSGTSKRPTGHLNQYKHITFPEQVNVESIKLDTWVEEMKIDRIDFIHCDVNGAEEEFFEGAKRTLNEKTKFIWIEELHDSGLWEDSEMKKNISEHLYNFDTVERHGCNVLWENNRI